MPLFRASSGLIARGGSLASSTSCCCEKTCLACPGQHDYWVLSPTCAQLPEPANCANQVFLDGDTRNGLCEKIPFYNAALPYYRMERGLDSFGWGGVRWFFFDQAVDGIAAGAFSEWEAFNLGFAFRTVCSPIAQGAKFYFGMDTVFVTHRKQSNPCGPAGTCMRYQETELRARTRLVEYAELATSDDQRLIVSECLQPSFQVKISNAGVEVAGTFLPFIDSLTTVNRICQAAGGCTDYLPVPQVPELTYTVYRRPCKLENPLP